MLKYVCEKKSDYTFFSVISGECVCFVGISPSVHLNKINLIAR